MPATVDGNGGLWSSFQADSAVFNGPDWNADVDQSAVAVPDRRRQGQTRKHHLDHADVLRLRSSGTQRERRPGVGGEHRQCGRHEQVLEVAARSSSCGTIGADGSIRSPPVYEDYDGLGFRVPLLIVSPYAKKGYVTHVQYETCERVALSSRTTSGCRSSPRATRARTIRPAMRFDYGQPPRKFQKIAEANRRRIGCTWNANASRTEGRR